MTGDQKLVGDRYILGDVLGRGGMAEVRRGVDTRLGRPVAIKRLTAELAADPLARQRFTREAKSAASLNHPSIVSVYDSGEDSDPETGLDVPFIVMELVEGETLRDLLRRDRRLSPERALEISGGVLAALRHSHQAGIVHRDIKPANVMLTDTGAVKVMDFGIARTVSASSTSFSKTVGVLGTAQYLSPEQARGETADARSDLYGAGCLLYELLVGRPPFIGETALSIAYQHVRETPVPPSEVDPQVPAAVDAVVLKALAKEPAARYQTAAEMSADVDRARAGQTVHAEPAPTPAAPTPVDDPERTTAHAVLDAPQPRTRARTRRGVVMLVSGLVALLLAVGAFSLSQTGRLGADREPSVAVPELVGSTRAEAGTRLRTAGLTARYQEVAGPAGVTVGRVTGQTPEAGVEVTGDSVVTVRVNAGPSAATIPTGLVGADVDDVRDRLMRLGFRNVRTQRDPDPGDSDPGEVLAIDPPAGTSVPLTRAVVVSYAERGEPTAAARDFDDDPEPSSTRSAAPASPSEAESSPPPTTPSSVSPTSSASSVEPSPSASSTSAEPNPGRPSASGRGQSRSSAPSPGQPSDSGNASGDDKKDEDEKDDDKKGEDDKSEDDKQSEDAAKDKAAADAARRG